MVLFILKKAQLPYQVTRNISQKRLLISGHEIEIHKYVDLCSQLSYEMALELQVGLGLGSKTRMCLRGDTGPKTY